MEGERKQEGPPGGKGTVTDRREKNANEGERENEKRLEVGFGGPEKGLPVKGASEQSGRRNHGLRGKKSPVADRRWENEGDEVKKLNEIKKKKDGSRRKEGSKETCQLAIPPHSWRA